MHKAYAHSHYAEMMDVCEDIHIFKFGAFRYVDPHTHTHAYAYACTHTHMGMHDVICGCSSNTYTYRRIRRAT
jgi:hypothetical protein